MNKPLLLAILVALGAGAYIYKQEKTIRDLQAALEAERVSNQSLTGDQARANAEVAELRQQNDVFKNESEGLRKTLAEGVIAGPDSAAGQKPDASKAQGGMKGIAKMFTDPEMKKSMRVQQMVGLRMMYGDLAKELNLSPQEMEQLMEILADRQMDLTSAGLAAMDGGDKDAQAAKMKETTKRYEEQLKAVLGDQRYKEMQTYETTMGDRWMLQQWGGEFAATGSPLEPKQKDQLLSVMREERKNAPAGSLTPGGSANPSESLKAIQSDDGIKKFVASQQDINARVLTRSREFLNADQIAALQKVQQQQAEFMSMQLKMSREMLGSGNK